MDNYYFIMTLLVVALLTGGAIFLWFIKREIDEIWEKLKKVDTHIQYDRELFDHHFKVTDQTILDLRSQRDELKQKSQ